MSSSNISSVPDTLLTAVDLFIETYYEFRKDNPKYKGFLGKFKLNEDKKEAEEHERGMVESIRSYATDVLCSSPFVEKEIKLENFDTILEHSFGRSLMKLIEDKGIDHVELYKKAHIDRKLFSKIRTQHNYVPSKRTIIALAIALELSLDETQSLLKRGGFVLSRSILFDVIIEYFILQENYNIHEINSILFFYKQSPLG